MQRERSAQVSMFLHRWGHGHHPVRRDRRGRHPGASGNRIDLVPTMINARPRHDPQGNLSQSVNVCLSLLLDTVLPGKPTAAQKWAANIGNEHRNRFVEGAARSVGARPSVTTASVTITACRTRTRASAGQSMGT